MNKTEKIFYDYLINEKKIPKENIINNPKSSPDFIVEENGERIGYEVKKALFKIIYIPGTQHNSIKNADYKTFIVLMKKGEKKPTKLIPYNKLSKKNPQIIDGYKIYIAKKDMATFNVSINLLKEWKKSITHNESIKDRIEEALKDNIKKHKEILIKRLNGK